MSQKITNDNLNQWLKNPFRETLVMGIINVTPDSFSDGGKYFESNMALEYSAKMINDGVDIIDIGGESTRPGAKVISIDQELKRTIPLIEKIRSNSPNILISIDTSKSEVAEKAILSGANIINDVSGLRNDSNMISIASKYETPIIIMHMQGNPRNMQDNPKYTNIIRDIYSFFQKQIKIALEGGLRLDQIILDPGIGFGKSIKDNFILINHLQEFCDLGLPVLIGPSKKSFIGLTLNESVDNRHEGTVAAVVSGILRGARMVRVHDVKKIKQAVKITELIRTSK